MVFTRGWGNLADTDLADHQAALLADPAFDPTFAQRNPALAGIVGKKCLTSFL
jgi:hypothetical protein